jgi:uncharacterized protein
MMNDATLEAAIKTVLQSDLVQGEVEFLWHAGEPLTAGILFYEKVVSLIRQYNTRNIKVTNSIQTNGTLINARWCTFFAENVISIGISIDGPEFLHDKHRARWSGSGSHRDVMRGFKLLKDHGILPGVICVLTRTSLRYPDEIFSFFLDNGVRKLAFNVDEVEGLNTKSSFASHGALSRAGIVREYREFMSRLFELWRPYSRQLLLREFVDLFSVIRTLLRDNDYCREPDETVGLRIITIQKNGDITTFSPEFAGVSSVYFDNFIVGNITEPDSLEAVHRHPVFLRMRKEIAEGKRMCADSCPYYRLCGGAFASNKYFENGSLKSTETTTCVLYRQTLASVLLDTLCVNTRA